MINLKKITAVVSSLMLFSNVFVLAADDLVWPEGTKAEILKLAKEQDRFVLLFVGNYNCPLCQASWAYFNQNTLRQIIEDNYNTWFFSYYEKGFITKNVNLCHFYEKKACKSPATTVYLSG
jgi:thioredoxin-related protein